MDNTKPLVSIIVRTKDRPKLLLRALQSIAAQTYRPLEVLLVNDGGCSLEIDALTRLLGDVSLRYLPLEKNRGRAGAGNAGIEASRGTYIGFLDDDDELYPDHLETLVRFLVTHDYRVAYTDAELVSRDFSPDDNIMRDSVTAVFSRDFDYDELLFNNYIPFHTLLFSSDVLERKGCLDESFNLYEDWDLLIRLAEKHVFFHIRKITAKYCQWSSQLQVNQSDADYMMASHLKVLDKHLHRFTPTLMYRMKQQRDDLAMQLEKARKDNRDTDLRLEGLIQERGGLLRSLEERDRLLEERAGIIRSLEDAIAQKDDQIFRRDAHISDLEVLVARKSQDLTRLIGDNREKDEQIMRLTEDLNVMRNTRGWKLLEKFRSVRGSVLPPETRRGSTYRLAAKSLGVLRREGFGSFLNKARQRMSASGRHSSLHETLPVLPDAGSSCPEHYPSPRAFRVLLVKWQWAGITNHYRIDNVAEYLTIGNIDAEIVDLEELPRNVPRAYEFDLVIIHRIPMNPLLREFIAACRAHRMIVIFDIDDYLFEPSVIHQIEWVRHTKETEREQLIQHMMQCRETLEACDYFISPTDFLAAKAAELGKKAYVIRNGFSRDLYRRFTAASEKRPLDRGDGVVRIGYFSGTNTHQKDFQSIAPAILRILREYEHVHLHICGLLDLDVSFEPYSQRIERVPLVPLEGLPGAVEACDINLAPLEPGNVFCEAKSELKYVYAGIMKIPTVATPTDAFRYAISNGENGFLASTVTEWHDCLKKLIENAELRRGMGDRACRHVTSEYAPEALANRLGEVYRDVVTDARRRMNLPQESITAGFVVADRIDSNGIHQRLIEIAGTLAERGHHVSLYYYGGKGSHDAASKGAGAASSGIVISDMEHILSADALICTDSRNSSVSVHRLRGRAANLIYMTPSEGDETIPYRWGNEFHVVPFSSDVGAIARHIEEIVWKK